MPEGHPFPMSKYPALFDILLRERLIEEADVVEPHEAAWADILLVHTPDYLGALASGSVDQKALRRLGFPWTPALLRRSRLAVQGTIDAAWLALQSGIAANLAGGTHHAFADHGEGYCVLNDVAIAIRVLQGCHAVRRALIVDLDVHQGNGTASIFASDRTVYTFSMHGQNNYPLRKERSSRDVGLADGTSESAYMEILAHHLPAVWDEAKPDIVFYLAGVDAAYRDRYGRLNLTPAGIRLRDSLVLAEMYRRGIPAVLLLAGGYAASAEATADLHAMVHREASSIYSGRAMSAGI